jgi:hypothetical protein
MGGSTLVSGLLAASDHAHQANAVAVSIPTTKEKSVRHSPGLFFVLFVFIISAVIQ